MFASTSDPPKTITRRRPLGKEEKFERIKATSSLMAVTICPLLLAMPPRRANLYTFGLSTFFIFGANHQLQMRTGNDLIWYIEAPLAKTREKITEMRLRRREEDRRRWAAEWEWEGMPTGTFVKLERVRGELEEVQRGKGFLKRWLGKGEVDLKRVLEGGFEEGENGEERQNWDEKRREKWKDLVEEAKTVMAESEENGELPAHLKPPRKEIQRVEEFYSPVTNQSAISSIWRKIKSFVWNSNAEPENPSEPRREE